MAKSEKIHCTNCGTEWYPIGDDQLRIQKGWTIQCPRCDCEITKEDYGKKMKVKYQIVMKVEVEVDEDGLRKNLKQYSIAEELERQLKKAMIDHTVLEIGVSRTGATGVTPVVNRPPHPAS